MYSTEARDAVKHPAMHKTAPLPSKMYLVQNVNSAELGFKAQLWGETQEQIMPSSEKREERGGRCPEMGSG